MRFSSVFASILADFHEESNNGLAKNEGKNMALLAKNEGKETAFLTKNEGCAGAGCFAPAW
ncbi:MAG: hypothetical protein IJR99_09965 [Kiritimatiellae bacterium]|nr:hypothetical protein [Kiritimatiellia bacterium]